MHYYVDQFNEPVAPRRRYAVGKSRASGQLCEAFECVETGELMLKTVKGGTITRVYDEDVEYRLDPSTVFTRVDAQGIPLERPEDDHGSSVRSAIMRARHHKDQLHAIERDLITELGADGDTELTDAIMQAIHADGNYQQIMTLIES
jgi:copper chaperone CopZ